MPISPSRVPCAGGLSSLAAERQAKVLRLINAYRVRGHQSAQLDPLHLKPLEPLPDLDPRFTTA